MKRRKATSFELKSISNAMGGGVLRTKSNKIRMRRGRLRMWEKIMFFFVCLYVCVFVLLLRKVARLSSEDL